MSRQVNEQTRKQANAKPTHNLLISSFVCKKLLTFSPAKNTGFQLRFSFQLLAFSFTTLLFADNRLHLQRADKLENITQNGQSVQILTGDVVFVKKDMTISSHRAEYRESSDQGWMTGAVSVKNDKMTLTCDSLHFDSKNDLFKAFQSTHIWDADYDLIADSLYYFSELDSGDAFGNTRLTQVDQIITADKISYVKPDETDAVSYSASGNVIITEEERTATCGFASYDHENETTRLSIQPKVIENSRTISGSEIILQYRDEELQNMDIPSDAHAVSTVSGWRESVHSGTDSVSQKHPVSYENKMSGKHLFGIFTDGRLDSMRLEGMATTLYHIFEDSLYQGVNDASGDTISMQFADDDLNRIVVIGGSRGTYTPDTTSGDMNSPVSYESKIIDYRVTEEITNLHQNAKLHYEDMDLLAGYVNIDWTTNLLHAFPTTPGDSTTKEFRPSLLETGREPMDGDSMTYNLITRHGRVVNGATKADDGFYYGEEIRNEDKSSIYVQNSIYTTCDLEFPHFHFDSDKMKMIQHDKVIAKPLVLYIGGIPIMGLPFAIFPHKGGARHSGWIMPSYGESRIRGQFIDGLGYYWAASPYWDTRFLLNFADKQGMTFKALNHYKKRYKYSGDLHLETRQFLTGGERDIIGIRDSRKTDYVLKWNHNQVMRRNQSFRVNASYYSNGEYNRETGLDPQKRLKQQAVSNATYKKNWRKSNNSLSVNLSVKQDLMANSRIDSTSVFYQPPSSASARITHITSTFPKLSFSHMMSTLFPTKRSDIHWYNTLKWSYSSTFTNQVQTWYEAEEINLNDSTTVFQWQLDENGDGISQSERNNSMDHSFSLNASQKIFKYISLVPSLSIQSKWIESSIAAAVDDSGDVYLYEKPGFAAKTTGRFSLNSKTNIYGLIPVNIAGLKAIRHVISPSIGYSYTPDFSKPLFGVDLGYYQTFQDTTWDRFKGTAAGSTPSSERQSMTMSMSNVFKAKIITKSGEEKKVDLLSWSMSSSYNFAADEFRLANLSSTLRTKIANILSLDMSMSHDFYSFKDGTRSPEFNRLDSGLLFPRLTRMSFSTGFSFSGKHLKGASEETAADTAGTTEEEPTYQTRTSFLDELKKPVEDGKLWSTRLSVRYSLQNSNPLNPTKTFWLNTNSSVQLTENWKLKYNARFDLIERNLVSHSVSLYRDLHCWELSLNWTPNGYGQGVYLKINVKSPTLSDLKLEQRGGIFQSRSW